MIGWVNRRSVAWAAGLSLVLVGIGIVLLFAARAGGWKSGSTQDIVRGLLTGGFVVLSAAWLLHFRRGDEDGRELGEERRKLDLATSNMAQGLVMFDASERVVLCNCRYAELYGLSPDIAKPGVSFRDLLLERRKAGSFTGDVDAHRRRVMTNLAEGKITSFITPAGDGRLVRIVNKPLGDGSWVATHEDVTEYQRLLEAHTAAEEAMRRQKIQLDGALDNIVQGLCIYDAEGRIVLFNRRYCELMDENADYLFGLSVLDLLRRRAASGAFDGDPDAFFASVAAQMRAGKIVVTETTRRTGSTMRVVHHPMEGGGWVSTFEDITEQRRAEQERDQNRAFLDLIIENVPSVIYVKNAADRKYVLVNRATERFWGRPRKDLIGKTSADLYAPEEAERIKARDDALLESGEQVFEEREVLTPQEGRRNIFARRLIIRDEHQQSRFILGVVDDVTERKLAEARIARLAHYDPLTELPNRTLFRAQLEKELSLVQRGGQLAVLCLDLDHFKGVNDTLGHPAGDQFLKLVARRLHGCLRDCDLIARLGGGEFAIVQTGLQDPKDAELLAQRLREAITAELYDLNGNLTTTDLSIGIALAPGDGTELDDLLKHADLALYGAKAEGRATYRYFEPAMNARMKRRRATETELRAAVAGHQFVLHYQPLMNLRTGTVTGCEALLRWIHPERGVIAPLEFIPVAEETGLINSIGEWVIRQACLDAMKWPDHVHVAVNVSPVQFRNPGLPLIVVASLANSGLPAHRLELEITESVLMQNCETTVATLHQLHDMGVRISMDDFGTGYSSLSYLRSFPFDKIKIDRSFIGDLSSHAESAAIVQSILNLASSLKMTTTAEGVETAVQQELLESAGCDEIQGFLFSPPRPAAEIADLLHAPDAPSRVA